MNTKVFNTRLQLKYDSFENWSKLENQFKLLAGEIAVVNVPAANAGAIDENAPGYNKKPAILFKVGDGENTFNDLPWASGLAADVYGWAKAENKPEYAASEISYGEGKTVSTEISDIWGKLGELTGEDLGGEGTSISDMIANGIKALDSASVTATGKYVTGVSVTENGKLAVSEADLPTYTLTTGDTNGTVKFNGTDVAVKGLGSAAYAETTAFDAAGTGAAAAAAVLGTEGDAATAATVYGAKAAAAAATEVANTKVASVTATDASITISGEATAPTVGVKVSEDADNALALTESGLKVTIPTAAEYEIIKETTAEEGYAATYKLFKDGTKAGVSINIPKDMVVSAGSVVELAEGEVEDLSAGTYIKLVLANANNETLYIPVGSLIEYVTSGSQTGDMVVIAIDETTHKVTATITDGTITLAKLETGIQTEINWVTNHKDTIESMEGKVAAWDAAEKNAKDYADGLIAGLDGNATATAEADGKVSVLTGIAQADGVISKDSEVTLEKVAKTGKLGDLVEDTVANKDTTDYVVFYCGTSEILTK